jgi:hypothetical protein
VRLTRLPWVVVISAVLFFVGCDDPQTQILRIFTNQGLTLLEPARSYISIGGIVLLPHGTNALEYEDPYDTLPPESGTSTNFTAILNNQTDTSATAAQVELLLPQMVSLPTGFSFEDGPQTVKLTQINSSGQRYTSPKVSTLLKEPNTASEINSRLQEGDRVFIVQEVYTATSLSVSASSGMSLAANVGGSPVTKSCSSGSGAAGSSGSGGSSAGTAGGSASGSAGKTAAGSSGSGGSGAGTAGGSASGSAGKTVAGSSGSGGSAGTGSGSAEGVSVGVCRNTTAELSFTSQTNIPFAVRLQEVEVGPGGVLRVKDRNFHLPNLALGNEEDVKGTVLINPANPVISKLKHITH